MWWWRVVETSLGPWTIIEGVVGEKAKGPLEFVGTVQSPNRKTYIDAVSWGGQAAQEAALEDARAKEAPLQRR